MGTIKNKLLITLLVSSVFGAIMGYSADSQPKMIYVEGGAFQMGCTSSIAEECFNEDQKPVHTVTVSSFYMAETEATNAQYAEFLNAYGSDVVKSGEYQGKLLVKGGVWCGLNKSGNSWASAPGWENHPGVPLTWYGALEYCKWRGGRLPTEAEWEYAARGGKKAKNTKYAGGDNLDSVAWFTGNSNIANSEREDGQGPNPVKRKAPNELGLYDMTGNVWEWCADWYNSKFYQQSDNAKDPLCTVGEDNKRVLRSGSWHREAIANLLWVRGWHEPHIYTYIFGVRCVMDSAVGSLKTYNHPGAEAGNSFGVNLFNHNLAVTFPASFQRHIGSVTLFNTKGMPIVGKNIHIIGGSTANLDISTLANGMYITLINTKDSNGKSFSATMPVNVR